MGFNEAPPSSELHARTEAADATQGAAPVAASDVLRQAFRAIDRQHGPAAPKHREAFKEQIIAHAVAAASRQKQNIETESSSEPLYFTTGSQAVAALAAEDDEPPAKRPRPSPPTATAALSFQRASDLAAASTAPSSFQERASDLDLGEPSSSAPSATASTTSAFCSASALPIDGPLEMTTRPPSPPPVEDDAPEQFRFRLQAVGLQYHDLEAAQALVEGDAVTLVRDPTNAHDENAILCCAKAPEGRLVAYPGEPVGVGHVSRGQAEALAPLIDSQQLEAVRVTVDERGTSGDHVLPLLMACEARGQLAAACRDASMLSLERAPPPGAAGAAGPSVATSKLIDTSGATGGGRAQLDLEASQGVAAPLAEAWPPGGPSPWQPGHDVWQPGEKAAPFAEYDVPWDAFDAAAVEPLTRAEVEAEQQRGWPPSAKTLAKLGLGPPDDEAWWASHGMQPPERWQLAGAADMVSHPVSQVRQSDYNKKYAAEKLSGAAHGAHAWLPATLSRVRETCHEPSFWAKRNGDGFIRAFGGPYVLGQDEGKLKLVRPAEHTALSRQLSRGHSMIYTATHLAHPAAPGFNTLIMSLNVRSSGFYYHQDDMRDVEAKCAPLVRKQPVVTTVFYEKPEDEGKESVLWRPIDNWQPRGDTFSAARCLVTTQGVAHVQRAGLQAKAKHGVMHTPGTSGRSGYRVALTGRITHTDAAQRVEEHVGKGHYSCTLGPDGSWHLPPLEDGH